MKIGHDGAGMLDEFGPDSRWAYLYDNPEDDAWVEEFDSEGNGDTER